jgi:translation elongation factor EF-1beta
VRTRAGEDRDVELKTLKADIEANVTNGFVQSSRTTTTPIVFVKKNDGGLRL